MEHRMLPRAQCCCGLACACGVCVLGLRRSVQVQASTGSTLANDFLSILWRNPTVIQHVLQRCRIQVQWRVQCGHDSGRFPISNVRKWQNNKLRARKNTKSKHKKYTNAQSHQWYIHSTRLSHPGSHTKAKANITTLVQVISECLCPDATSGYHGKQQQSPHVVKCQKIQIKCTSIPRIKCILYTQAVQLHSITIWNSKQRWRLLRLQQKGHICWTL